MRWALGLRAVFNPRLANVDLLAAAALQIGANRLVLFADVPATLSYCRQGLTPQNKTTISMMSPSEIQEIARRASHLLTLLGYNEEG